MCKGHNHSHHSRISDIHSGLEREFYFARSKDVIKIDDDDSVLKMRAELKRNPHDYNAHIALGDALAYQMRYNEALEFYEKAREINPHEYIAHRKCAVRYLSILDLQRAKDELIWCAKHTDNLLDVKYLQAINAYCGGDFELAIDFLKECYPLSRDNGEMYVAVIFWHIICLVELNESVDGVLKYYFDKLDGGHHVGYMQAVKLFKFDDLHAGDLIEIDDELNKSIYLFGLYAYYKYIGELASAEQTLDEMLSLQTYFSSFAYLGAYCQRQRNLQASEKKLLSWLENKRFALAFSGGTDSAFLLSMAKFAGADVKAYFVKSEFQPSFEVDDAKKLAEKLNISCEFVKLNVLCDDFVVTNGADRCYYCKRKIFGAIRERASHDGYAVVADGTNASDDLKERAGARAMREFDIVSPLRDCGLTKSDIRYLSRKYGVFTWDKPSYSCLATRVHLGERITEEALKKIEYAEGLLFECGYKNFRVRTGNNCASIEIARAQNERFQSEKEDIFTALSACFDSVKQSDILR